MNARKHSRIWSVFSWLVVAALMAACAAPATPTQAPEATLPPETEPTTAPETEATTAPETEPTAEGEEPVGENYSPDIVVPDEPIVVTFASWVHTNEPDDSWEIMAQEFNAIYPNITIEFQDVPAEEMHDVLLTRVGANNPPDAAFLGSGDTGEFAQRSALVALDDFVSKSNIIDLDDYVPAFLTAAQANGQLYGLPIDGESTGLFYRTDRFEEAGLDPNKPPATWEEFEQYAQALTDVENNKYGTIVFATEAAYYWYPWLWQAGGDTLNPENPDDVIWDSPEGQRAADFYVNLTQYSPPDFLNSNSWDGRVAFANGDVAMYVAGAWFAGTLLSEFPDATGLWATAPLPSDERCATTLASDNLVVFEGSQNKEAAYKWIEFVSAPHNMQELNMGSEESPTTLLPPRTSLLESDELYENREFMRGFAEDMNCAIVSTVVQPDYYLAEEVLNEHLARAMYGEFPDGASAVTAAAEEAEAALAE
jgi:multiple sugar transport system substrate-binding protein